MKNNTTLYLTRGALIAALYVALTYLAAILGLSSGVIQFRISEMLTVLPIFFSEAVVGLALGCAIANLLTGCVFWDILFGSIATLIGALGAYLLRKLPDRLKWICTIPTIASNAIIIPFVLIYAYGATDSFLFLAFTIGLGELVCAGICGSVLYYALKNSKAIR